jgi:hypothetical protein
MQGSNNVKICSVTWNELNTFVCRMSSVSGYKVRQRQNVLVASYRHLLYMSLINCGVTTEVVLGFCKLIHSIVICKTLQYIR